ncbi:BFD-like [2Fe-2S] binding domain protein [Acididesulfobacillus acetoxydans]|uniref:BFD-like [2Fe-2S] binding domain n=1 Tax=Acididesulfobacillus acetoxydans TaxID=1561005 RepID=A0A8S0Y2P1_9FIRM|nr:(2Fe-2S)-binding protein [Acididesulfobacillus acetoxydans]CAA7601045.1 BFD-like [2Fe-2S] binding domain protein [Acididesulfobacillus acetoxydans]CEJ06919.1 BFD-like [2Fe-2S] binding domain [Acididesulfobacillus acetoxydans]
MVEKDLVKDVVICRCEEVTRAEIGQVIREGLWDIDEIRKFSRAGMGLCQGRTCQKLLCQVVKEELGGDPLELGADLLDRLPKERPPLGATKLGELVPCSEG